MTDDAIREAEMADGIARLIGRQTARIEELLAANTREVERRRQAEGVGAEILKELEDMLARQREYTREWDPFNRHQDGIERGIASSLSAVRRIVERQR